MFFLRKYSTNIVDIRLFKQCWRVWLDENSVEGMCNDEERDIDRQLEN